MPKFQIAEIKSKKHSKIVVQEAPKYPGLQVFYDDFMKTFNNYGRVKKVLGRINNTEYFFMQYIENGVSLGQAYEKKRGNYSLEQTLEKESLGERILISMLLFEQQNGLEDEVLEKHPEQPDLFRLVNINVNGNCFVPPIIKKEGTCSVNVKNVLFCLEEMKELIHINVVKKFQRQFDLMGQNSPGTVIRRLLYKLINLHQKFVTRNERSKDFFTNQFAKVDLFAEKFDSPKSED